MQACMSLEKWFIGRLPRVLKKQAWIQKRSSRRPYGIFFLGNISTEDSLDRRSQRASQMKVRTQQEVETFNSLRDRGPFARRVTHRDVLAHDLVM